MNKYQKIIPYVIVAALILILSYLIFAGSNRTALECRKNIFVFKQNSVLPIDPSYYFKGVQDPSKIKIDLSKVNIKKAGIYKVPAKQTSKHYEIIIKIEN